MRAIIFSNESDGPFFIATNKTKETIQMDNLTEILAKIRAAVGEESTPKIDGLLKQIEAGFASVADDLKAANAESKERKIKIRDLTGQLDDATLKVKDLDGKANNPDLAKEMADLKQFKADALKTKRAAFSGEFATVAKHPNFEKAKEQFKLPKPADDGTFDFSKSTDEEIAHNMAKLDEYRKIGYFEEQKPAPGFNGPRNNGQPDAGPKEATREGLNQFIAAGMQRYK
jgi:hypothetical protein